MSVSPVRQAATISGVVQGVGFRPFVFNLARGLGLTGSVTNSGAGVELQVQGSLQAVEEFFARLASQAPPLALIQEIQRQGRPPLAGESQFCILASQAGAKTTLISPDVAVCEACLAEINDPADRRYRYPFTNCTHCGPRYTIIKDLPYDRPLTTMAGFELCPQCRAEYHDPTNRRFHAQPTACPVCGPRLWLADAAGVEIPSPDPIQAAGKLLREGNVLAIKGLGGFHLACLAADPAAVDRLRARKHREEKPLAVMVRDLDTARTLGVLDPGSLDLLASRERPIVLVPQAPGAPLAPGVAPGNRLIGLMLPYTPLHYLLLAEPGCQALVMTSGNLSDDPICRDNAEAIQRLGGIADAFLLHDREIHLRADDSVQRVVAGRPRQLRRSRGYAPSPVVLPPGMVPVGAPPILAVGGHLKNTLCLLRGKLAFFSQHVGDLDDLATLAHFEHTAQHLQKVLEATPAILACDLHPDYLSTRWAQDEAARLGIPLVRVQHHHAHLCASMAEHGMPGPVVGLVVDGTGYGPDHTIWGGEVLRCCQEGGYRRLGRLSLFGLPGGDAAVREPWRTGLSLLRETFGADFRRLALPLLARHQAQLNVVQQMLEQNINTPLTSSLGRLFDGLSAICDVRHAVAYEGQAAVELEQAMAGPDAWRTATPLPFNFEADGDLVELDWRPAVRRAVEMLQQGAAPGAVSASFHNGLIRALGAWLEGLALTHRLHQVCLGGGCLHNAALLTGLAELLPRRGFQTCVPAAVPAGDGGLALGQALAAAAAWARGLPAQGEYIVTELEQ